MICIDNGHTDPYFNLAVEEYLLKNFSEDIFMVYRDEPSVIVGKHQHAEAEVNRNFTERKGIKLARRYSGGGTVYHDLGNINLCFIETSVKIGFDRFSDKLVQLLSHFGIDAERDERRALKVRGLKISGSAQCLYKNRIMYHATLLYSSDLACLNASLSASGRNYARETNRAEKNVRSVYSEVANLSCFIEKAPDSGTFKEDIIEYFINEDKFNNKIYSFNEEDIRNINRLKTGKYATDRWNYEASADLYVN